MKNNLAPPVVADDCQQALGVALALMTPRQLDTFRARWARQKQLLREGRIDPARCFALVAARRRIDTPA